MSIALLITGKDDQGRHLARLVYSDNARSLRVGTEELPIVPQIGRYLPEDRSMVKTPVVDDGLAMPVFEPGDVVLSDGRGWPDGEGVSIYLIGQVTALGRAHTEDEAVALIQEQMASESRRGYIRQALDDFLDLNYEADAERAAAQPNEALILAWLSEDGDIDTQILDGRGSFFFWNLENGRSCDDFGVMCPEGPGLWLLTKGEPWSSRDWESGMVDDYGLDGEIRAVEPVTAAEHFGLSVDDVMDLISDAYPYQYENVLTAILEKPGGSANPASVTP